MKSNYTQVRNRAAYLIVESKRVSIDCPLTFTDTIINYRNIEWSLMVLGGYALLAVRRDHGVVLHLWKGFFKNHDISSCVYVKFLKITSLKLQVTNYKTD